MRYAKIAIPPMESILRRIDEEEVLGGTSRAPGSEASDNFCVRNQSLIAPARSKTTDRPAP